ncbi:MULTISPECIES: hypothetical protein [Streptomyces]|uniref:hypothetical protein n=1 Tax=Streptomyces TaxID=1883 RepID=UPI00163D1BCC|nr:MULTISPECIES: hypothetical protein [Streptomyces]MBC2876347.1 hypothetical protein [Streptomyces sp. TYQ1024]UBI35437.1 hypothetical protein K7I03_02455 [Streptomyces mobaraensis]UKW28029.1 hypothetical protein MCU78_02485 [Streptomyces sp. TYQ1024]
MNNVRRTLAALALAGAVLPFTGTAHADENPVTTVTGGILGLGDSGGQNRDESSNQALHVIGDSLMNGLGNTFTPVTSIGGISGVGSHLV